MLDMHREFFYFLKNSKFSELSHMESKCAIPNLIASLINKLGDEASSEVAAMVPESAHCFPATFQRTPANVTVHERE